MIPGGPEVDPRRERALFEELWERAQTWVPGWRPGAEDGDFGKALLRIAATLSAEVTRRLAFTPQKAALGLLDWLGLRPRGARAARLPVVFKMTDQSVEPVLAEAPVRLRAGGEEPIGLETLGDVLILPGRILQLLAVDPAQDAYYRPPPDVFALADTALGPTNWRVKSLASASSRTLQISPAMGLTPGAVIAVDGLEYDVAGDLAGDLLPIEPPAGTLGDGSAPPAGTGTVAADTPIERITSFAPFDGGSRNRQDHHLYFGDDDALNLEAPATIAVAGGASLPDELTWEYYGKAGDGDPAWQPLDGDPPSGLDLTLRKRQSGAIEKYKLFDRFESRWIRARRKTVTAGDPVSRLALRVNCARDLRPPPDPNRRPDHPPELKAVANTAPLVPNDGWIYPFGTLPRQFDSFFLACPEAFSKPGARVRLHLEMSAPTMASFVVMPELLNFPTWVFGVGQDGALHRWSVAKDPEAEPVYLGLTRPDPALLTGEVPRFKAADPAVRPLLYRQGLSLMVELVADGHLWKWTQTGSAGASGAWTHGGAFSLYEASDERMVQLERAGPYRLALTNEGRILACALSEDASKAQPVTGGPWRALVPVSQLGSGGGTSAAFAITPNGSTDLVWHDGTTWQVASRNVGVAWSPTVKPIAVRGAFGLLLAGARVQAGYDQPVAILYPNAPANLSALGSPNSPIAPTAFAASLLPGERMSWSLGWPPGGADSSFTLLMLVAKAGDTRARLARWRPLAASGSAVRVEDPPPVGIEPAETPVAAGTRLLTPGRNRDLLASAIRRPVVNLPAADLLEAVILPNDITQPWYMSLNGGPAARVPAVRTKVSGGYLLLRLPRNSAGAAPTITHYQIRPKRTALPVTGQAQQLTIPAAAADIIVNKSQLLIEEPTDPGRLHIHLITAKQADSNDVNNMIVTLSPPPSAASGARDSYLYKTIPLARPASVRPLIVYGGIEELDGKLFEGGDVEFPTGFLPLHFTVTDLLGAGANASALLDPGWTSQPGGTPPVALTLDGEAEWKRFAADVSANPELSWEYWNGSGWWRIGGLVDGTLALKQSGEVVFTVPGDFGKTDVLGQVDYWIRARLTGGDYGTVRYKVAIAPPPPIPAGTAQIQTSSVDSSEVRPPVARDLWITYEICQDRAPRLLVTWDSGGIRDQSDANRTPGARIDAFVPLTLGVGRPGGAKTPGAADTDNACCAPCEDKEHGAGPAGGGEDGNPPGEDGASSERALYLAFSAELHGGPIQLLFLTDGDRDHDSAAPLIVEAWRRGRFEKLLTDDGTRGLGESGIVSVLLDTPATRAELFGVTGFWLRVRPARGAADWRPRLRGIYLNAAWAEAAETQEREPLGSSDGSPGQVMGVARPPVLGASMELRVREPIGAETAAALSALTPGAIATPDGLPGDWVLWSEVDDPADAGPGDRVYSLDAGTGEVRFGDGRHGLVPPPGRDNVMAFRYRRGGGAAANAIARFAPLALVSPLHGIEATVAIDDAAGGADPETPELVQRRAASTLRARGRIVTLRDLEQAAVASGQGIAQAGASCGPDGIRLAIVASDGVAQPGSARLRELRNYLLEQASSSLGLKGALEIFPAPRRPFRLKIELQVERVELAGRIARDAKERILALFDPVAGGRDGGGWRLGDVPDKDEIAGLLTGVKGIENVSSIELLRDDGSAAPLRVESQALAVLADEGIEFKFEPAAVPA